MNNIKQYNNVRTEIESHFIGLPHAHARIVSALITKANPETGIIENITYSDLATLLTVDPASGRKDSGTPQKQTIRSYLRTIESQFSADFKIISDGQKLKIQLPTLPSVYASHFDYTELYTEQVTVSYTPTALINIGETAANDVEISTEEYTEPYTDEYTAEPDSPINAHAIKPNFQPNNKHPVSDESAGIKKPISDDFYPSQFAIDKAISLGFSKAADPDELRKFILFNQASETTWRNYDYVFIMWAQSSVEREAAQKAKAHSPKLKQTYSRNHGNESIERQTVTQRVIAAWSDEQLEFCPQTRRFQSRGAPVSAPIKTLDFDIVDATV